MYCQYNTQADICDITQNQNRNFEKEKIIAELSFQLMPPIKNAQTLFTFT